MLILGVEFQIPTLIDTQFGMHFVEEADAAEGPPDQVGEPGAGRHQGEMSHTVSTLLTVGINVPTSLKIFEKKLHHFQGLESP